MSDDSTSRAPAPHHLAAFGQVAGELVHDLANEIQVLQGWALLARGEAEAGRAPLPELNRVVDLAGLLGHMLRDVLDTVAGQAVSPEVVFDPHALTEAILNDRVRELSPVEVRLLSLLPAGIHVHGRASFWTRVLGNLLANAVRHASGEILVRLDLERGPAGRTWVVLRIEDDGPGIDPEERRAVFRPFWRGEQGGTGLGLSSVVWAVGQLRGTIRCAEDSTLGGAAFEVRVPTATLPVAPAELASDDLAGGLSGVRLVLVDDDLAVRMALSRLLHRAGAEVRELDPTGLPEEELVRRMIGGLPDVILMDLRLGDRGGVALWRRLCLETPPLGSRVAFLSGLVPGDSLWEEARATGQPVLGKPFDLSQLVRTLSRLRTGD